MTQPRLLVRLEGAVAAAAALTVYFNQDHPWWLFLLLVLAPDLTFIGYLAGTTVGAAFYNTAHAYIAPLITLTAGDLAGSSGAVAVALVWLVHIGFDRALGYGLKYPTAFKDTHLQRV
ncbi:MAG: DUF4260 domain-containing protein [Gaiellaceae bacterium]